MATDEISRQGPLGSCAVDENGSAEIILKVGEALRGLKFGQVTITVHDGAVVQIERLERTRLQRRVQ